MGLSNFNWSVLHDNGTVIKVYTETPEIALSIAYMKTKDEQPLAIIRGDCSFKDDDAINGKGENYD